MIDVSHPRQLFDIRKVTIEADTTSGVLRNAGKLAELVDRFKSEEDGWFDDELIDQMITLAGQTGDITRNPVRLGQTEFE